MPVLEQLDKARAESLLGQNSEVQAALKRYPQGVASMNALPTGNTQSGTRHMPGMLSIGAVDTAQLAAEETPREINETGFSARQKKIPSRRFRMRWACR
jgi:hypothetical protein